MEVIKKKEFYEGLLSPKSINLKKAIESNTIQAIPLDKIKQAKKELKSISIEVYTKYEKYEMVEIHDVLAILDKLIAESEE